MLAATRSDKHPGWRLYDFQEQTVNTKSLWIKQSIIVIACNLAISTASGEEMSLGDAHAPVTLIQYGSFTCSNCVKFHRTVFPQIKEDYIHTGTVRFIYRHFPTSDAAAEGALAAQCAGDKFYEMLDELYSSVPLWHKEKNKTAIFTQHASSLELNQEAFLSCIADNQGLEDITQQQQTAKQDKNILGTPTFIINGKTIRGIKTFVEMENLIQEALDKEN